MDDITKYSNPPIYRASGGKAKMHGISGDTVNRGRLNIGFYCKTRYWGNIIRHGISWDTVNRGPVNLGMTVYNYKLISSSPWI